MTSLFFTIAGSTFLILVSALGFLFARWMSRVDSHLSDLNRKMTDFIVESRETHVRMEDQERRLIRLEEIVG